MLAIPTNTGASLVNPGRVTRVPSGTASASTIRTTTTVMSYVAAT